ncbi:hypothetical protein EOJ32_17310 (plasmid) [Paracoccus sp. Arc7-R13]|uniref:hypothetical protein n=1 Tax=Paracoccus sp. Arc7-R13 TaxID=2500532 RepID=UPI000FDBD6E6|nr:hypothetical protein [Paracoccus sp. Arc7-R13]AZY95557.1 hypothetical protein EOJ32_17310 [Paracoccus sp. Arc7-R13]
MTFRIATAVMVFCAVAAPAFAWDETTDFRGLHIYTASADGIALTAVCDPDGAFIPPTNHLQVDIQGQWLKGPYTLESEGNTFAGTMIAGTAVSRDKADWQQIIAILQSGSELKLTAGDQTYQVNTGTPFPVSCGASE